MPAILVLAEVDSPPNAAVRKSTLELLVFARRLGEPAAVVCGPVGDSAAETLFRHGATAVYACEAPELAAYLIAPKVEVLMAALRRTSSAAVLLTSTAEGKEIAARIAVRLESGVITDATDVQSGQDGPLVVTYRVAVMH